MEGKAVGAAVAAGVAAAALYWLSRRASPAPSLPDPPTTPPHLFLDAVREVLACGDLRGVLDATARCLGSLLSADAIHTYLLHAGAKALRSNVTGDAVSLETPSLLATVVQTLAAQAAGTGDPHFNAACDSAGLPGDVSSVAMPLLGKNGHVVAVVLAVRRAPFEAAHLQIARKLAYSVGPAVVRMTQEPALDVATSSPQFERLIHLVQSIANETETVSVIERVIDAAYALLAAERVTLYLVDEGAKELVVSSSKDVGGSRIPITAGLAGYIAISGQPINIADAYADSRFNPSLDEMTGFCTRAVIGVPVRDRGGRIVGVLQAINKAGAEQATFSAMDMSVFSMLASHAGVALRKAELLSDVVRANRKAQALLEVVKFGHNNMALEEYIQCVIQTAYKLVGVERVSVFLLDAIKQELWVAVSKDAFGVRIPLGVGIAGSVAATGEAIITSDAYTDPRFDSTLDAKLGFTTKSLVCMPITLREGSAPLGVLQAINKLGGPFDDADVSVLEAFCSEVATALNSKSVEASLTKLVSDQYEDVGFDVSLVSLFGSSSQLGVESNVQLRRVDTSKPISWPRELSAATPMDKALLTWDFDCFAAPRDSLVQGVVDLMSEVQLLQRFAIPHDTLASFLGQVQQNYHDNPFHNFLHGWSVFHATFLLVSTTSIMHMQRPLDTLAVLVAALCHDIDHPGHTNAFEVNSMSPLAVLHSDDAVLERHHAHVTFTILRKESCNLFSALDEASFRSVRKIIVSSILATDMSHHFDMVTSLSARFMPPPPVAVARSKSTSAAPKPRPGHKRSSLTSNSVPPREVFDVAVESERVALAEAIVHTCDLSGQAYTGRVAAQWGARVLAEFREQAALEKERGLPVAPFMSALDTELQAAKLQLSFVDNIVLPLWSRVADLVGGLDTPLHNLHANRLHYEADVLKLRKEEGGGAGKE